jgi:ABC-type methionine transport system ATPase subunit
LDCCLSCCGLVAAPGAPPIDLEVRGGEFVAVREVPPRAESPLLSVVAMLAAPAAGGVTLKGQAADYGRPGDLLPLRARMGYVGPGSALISNLSLFDNIAYGHRYQGVDEAEVAARVRAAAALLGLEGALDLRPAAMPFEVRRLGVYARELAKEPWLMILDHASLDLGEDAMGRVSHALKLRKRWGLSALIGAEPALAGLCDRLIVIEEGQGAREMPVDMILTMAWLRWP